MAHEEITECVRLTFLTPCSVVVFFPNIQDDHNADDTNNAQVSTYIAETVESEVADEGSGPYEDEGQDNYLEDVKEHNDDTLGEEHFVIEVEEW